MSNDKSRGTSRGEFLKQAAGVTVVVAGAGVGAGIGADPIAAAIAPRTAAAGNRSTGGSYSLEIEGINVGALAGASGGVTEYEVLLDPVGSDYHIQTKYLGQAQYEDFTIRVGCGMGKPMYDWIKDTFDTGSSRKNGAIVLADFNHKEVGRREFTDALITEVTIPALNAASKEPGYLEVTFSPTSAADVGPSGSTVQAPPNKPWLLSHFRIKIDGLQTARVSSIDSFTWKQLIRDDVRVQDAGDLGVTFAPASLPSWQLWYDNFAAGDNPGDERNGVLALGGKTGSSPGAVLNLGLFNLGIYSLDAMGAVTSRADSIRRVRAELYCERGHWDIAPGNKV